MRDPEDEKMSDGAAKYAGRVKAKAVRPSTMEPRRKKAQVTPSTLVFSAATRIKRPG